MALPVDIRALVSVADLYLSGRKDDDRRFSWLILVLPANYPSKIRSFRHRANYRSLHGMDVHIRWGSAYRVGDVGRPCRSLGMRAVWRPGRHFAGGRDCGVLQTPDNWTRTDAQLPFELTSRLEVCSGARSSEQWRTRICADPPYPGIVSLLAGHTRLWR